MAGVFELLKPQKRTVVVVHCNPKALELQMAKEILAEVFRVRLSEVDEMIQNRFEAASSEGVVSKLLHRIFGSYPLVPALLR